MRNALIPNRISWIISLPLLVWSLTGAVCSGQILTQSTNGVSTNTTTSAYTVVSRGPNHRIWQKVISVTNTALGRVWLQTNSYTELASGMHYWNGTNWAESQALIAITTNGAAATQGRHAVAFLSNPNTTNAVDLTMPDGTHLRSHVLGLSYYDTATGSNAMIATVKDSTGAVSGSNQVIYADTFTDYKADIHYTYTRAGFEQDIILRESLDSPTNYNLSPATTRLQIWTEFLNPPTPAVRTNFVGGQPVTQTLQFNSMRMGPGQAFSLGETNGASMDKTPVQKDWRTIDGRTFLIESVPYPAVKPRLDALSSEQHASVKSHHSESIAIWKLPPSHPGSNPTEMKIAAATKSAPGVLIDYPITLDGTDDLTDYIFQGDTTYLITGNVNLYGTVTLEGGAVIKMGGGQLTLPDGVIDCQTAPYRPVVMTSMNDDTLGTVIDGSSGTPDGYDYWIGLDIQSGSPVLNNIRICYGTYCIYVESSDTVLTMRNAQWVHCHNPFELEHCRAEIYNALMVGVDFPFLGRGYHVVAENVTIDSAVYYLTGNWDSADTSELHMANCIAVGVNGLGDAATNDWDYSLVDTNAVADLFQTVGSASYYLANDSPYRGAGTTNISADLATDLQNKTTWPPVEVYQDTFYTDSPDLSPLVPREGDGPFDLGFAYDPIDYAFGGVAITNVAMTIAPGTAIATFAANFDSYAIGMLDGSSLACTGTPLQPVRIFSYNCVQEQSNTNWHETQESMIAWDWESGPDPILNFRFTKWSVMAADVKHFRGMKPVTVPINFQDNEFYGGQLYTGGPALILTNCLLSRVFAVLDDSEGGGDMNPVVRNCLSIGGTWYLAHDGGGTWTCQDNLFDGTAIFQDADLEISSYNAYVTNSTFNNYITNFYQITPTNEHDVILTESPTYEVGPLGRWYYPVELPLIDAGSQNATNAGLYHYTTMTDQTVEGDSPVDIGYHYVAVDGDGYPLDKDGDGTPDYVEDANGNGVVDGTESDWQNALVSSAAVVWSPPFVQLGHWRFNTNTWPRDCGEGPLAFGGLSLVSSWNSNAVSFGTNSYLLYKEVETSGHTNIQFNNGTIRFWFQPNWSSTNLGGIGKPPYGGGFINTGNYQPDASIGQWSLYVNAAGNTISLDTQSNGTEVVYFEAPCLFVSNLWYQIALTYSPSNVALYVNGALLSTAYKQPFDPTNQTNHTYHVGNGLSFYPSSTVRSNQFALGQQINGQMEELETFNYPLSAHYIAAGFPAFTNTPASAELDTDGDGRSDLLERYVDGTGTNDISSLTPCRLGYWRFNSSDWVGEQGQKPFSYLSVSSTPSWSGTGVEIGKYNYGRLMYQTVETNGWANFNCRNGAARLWFKPNWNSGSGPKSGPLLYLGYCTRSRWSLEFTNSGSTIRLITTSNYVTDLNLSTACSLSANRWYQIALNYSPTNSVLYVNGILVATGSGISHYPSFFDRRYFTLGNTTSGLGINGQFDELETFNYQLSAAEITNSFNLVHNIDSDLNGTADILEDIKFSTNTPFLGQPVVITGVVEAEQFDAGGKGFAYTNVATNAISDYRPTGMFITNCNDLGLGYCLDKIRAGEWVKYTLDVRVGQPYAIEPRVAGIGSNGVFKIEFSTNGSNYYAGTGNLTITTTNWTNLTVKGVSLVAGTNYMRMSFLTNGLTNGASIGFVGKFNYISIYPSWNEGVPGITVTNRDLTNGLIANTGTWYAATNNSAKIQQVLDSIGGTNGATLLIPSGTYYVAPLTIDESKDADFNTCVFVTRDNLEIAGNGKTNTTLIGFNRATTIIYLGETSSHLPAQHLNFTLHDLTLETRPHLISVTNTTSGGYTNYYEKGALNPTVFDPGYDFQNTGALVYLAGKDATHFAANLLITNCLFRNPDHAIAIVKAITNCAVRGCDFICWEGTNAFTGETNAAASPRTITYPFNHGVIFLREVGANNIIVDGNTFNGNPNLTSITTNTLIGTNWTRLAADGLVFFLGGGNWFIARNSITNNGLEGVQVTAGPTAIVGNIFQNYVSMFPACAVAAHAVSDVGVTGAEADYYNSVIGNAITGGRQGVESVVFPEYANHSFRLNLSGNTLNLYPATTHWDDYPGAAATLQQGSYAWICGNTLQAGGHGLLILDIMTNLVVLKNDFSGATHRSIGYSFGVTDEAVYAGLQGVVVAKNILNQGDSYHLKFPYPDSGNWFLLKNHYWNNGTNDVPMVLDAASSPVHFVP